MITSPERKKLKQDINSDEKLTLKKEINKQNRKFFLEMCKRSNNEATLENTVSTFNQIANNEKSKNDFVDQLSYQKYLHELGRKQKSELKYNIPRRQAICSSDCITAPVEREDISYLFMPEVASCFIEKCDKTYQKIRLMGTQLNSPSIQ